MTQLCEVINQPRANPNTQSLFFQPLISSTTSYVVSVQQVSITLSGVSSNTATITAPAGGNTQFIIFQGCIGSILANDSDDLCRVELTNTTTVTAFRASTAGTAVANAIVIEATANLIKSVQTGTITLTSASTSNTATISAVTNTNTATHLLGFISNNGNASFNNFEFMISLSSTTVTATVLTNASASRTCGFCIIEFQGAALNSSVQNVAMSVSMSTTTTNVTITSVTANNTILIDGGHQGNSSSSAKVIATNAQLTSGTNVRFTVNTAPFFVIKHNLTVVEFAAGVLNSAVQRGTIATSASTSNTATITSVNTAKAFCNWLYNTTAATTSLSDYVSDITQTNATTLTMTVNSSSTNSGSYEVAEFT